jgi:hypothetical protein
LKQTLKKHIINSRGPRLKQKLIVFESDDWGAIRIPNLEVRGELWQNGLTRTTDSFSRFDTLESAEDYKTLFDVLAQFKDQQGNHPCFTANFILNNPDFKKIASGNFQKYHHESFQKTYANYSGGEKTWDFLKEGIQMNLIKPQFHGSEHLNVVRWMKLLQENNERYRLAFDNKCFAIDEIGKHNRRDNLMATYDYNNQEELDFIKESIAQGLKQFEEIFGFHSKTSIAPCYVWDKEVEKAMATGNVNCFQGSFLQNIPQTKISFQKKYRYIGQQNKENQTYLVRNCLFEPSVNNQIDWVNKCMESIDIAFKWGKPSIIGTHRINFVGRLDKKQRDKNLDMLTQLLAKIVQKWPDAQFTDTASLYKAYQKP